ATTAATAIAASPPIVAATARQARPRNAGHRRPAALRGPVAAPARPRNAGSRPSPAYAAGTASKSASRSRTLATSPAAPARADRPEVRALAGRRRGVEEGLLEPLAPRRVRGPAGVFRRRAVDEVLVLVGEIEVAVERERADVGEVLDLVGRPDVVRDERQGQ